MGGGGGGGGDPFWKGGWVRDLASGVGEGSYLLLHFSALQTSHLALGYSKKMCTYTYKKGYLGLHRVFGPRIPLPKLHALT